MMTSWLSWTTAVWSMLISACLTLALLHLFVGVRHPRQWAHLCFSIAACGVAVITGMELAAMHATSAAQISTLLRWVHLPALVFSAALVCFIRCSFGAGRLWLGATACVLRALVLLLSFTTGPNLFFKEMTGLKHIAAFGGETISIVEGVPNPWSFLGPLSAAALAAFVFDACLTLWRRGVDTDRRRAVAFSCCIIFFLLLAPAHTALVHAGIIRSSYIIGLCFMPTVLAMSFMLSNEVLRAAQLAQRLQASEAALRQSERRMELAANAAELGLWEWDIVHDEIWSTDKGFALFGLSQQDRIGFEAFLKMLYDDDREPVKQAVQKALAGNGLYEGEFRVRMPDGQISWLAARGRTEFGDDKPLRMYGVAVDISRRKQAELEAQQQRQELAHLSRVTLLGELSGSLAHELSQPLAAILSNAQAALRFLKQETPNLDEVRDILNDIVDEDKHAGEVIHRLRLLLKKGEVQHRPFNVNDAVQDVLKLLRGDFLNHYIAVNVDLAPQLLIVVGDRVQIRQVLLNLLLNGCEAMADTAIGERRFHIRSALNGATVLVSIGDQGRGIADNDTEQIFTPFFTTKAQGMGLGLAVCRSIVSAHGGKLWAERNGGQGAIFYIALPATPGIHL
ncbi:MAG: sensor histidine kinase [Gammaproteobacteria bacterium]